MTDELPLEPGNVRGLLDRMVTTLGRRRDRRLEAQLDSYARELAHLPPDAVQAAIETWPRHGRGMPMLRDLLRLAHRGRTSEKAAGPEPPSPKQRPPIDFFARVRELTIAALSDLERSALGLQAQAEGWWWPLRGWASELIGFQARTIARCEVMGIQPVRPGRKERLYRELYQLEAMAELGRVSFNVPAEVVELCRSAEHGANAWLQWQARLDAERRLR